MVNSTGPEVNQVNPAPLTEDEYGDISPRNVTKIKKLDCINYNKCLDLAYRKDWFGFTCTKCKCYSAPSIAQQAIDHEALTVAYIAAGNIWKNGRANRVVGVKPGTEKKNKRLPVLTERLESDSKSVLVLG